MESIDPGEMSPNRAFIHALMGKNVLQALSELQVIDTETLVLYLSSPMGQQETEALLRDLTFFEAKVDKSFLRGLCLGIAASIQDFMSQKNGDAVVPTLRAGLSLLRNTNTDVITGKGVNFT